MDSPTTPKCSRPNPWATRLASIEPLVLRTVFFPAFARMPAYSSTPEPEWLAAAKRHRGGGRFPELFDDDLPKLRGVPAGLGSVTEIAC